MVLTVKDGRKDFYLQFQSPYDKYASPLRLSRHKNLFLGLIFINSSVAAGAAAAADI